ncbi:MAG: 3-deoxy-D-manno-octulosonic-acid transferase [Saprospiraceae bacterium]
MIWLYRLILFLAPPFTLVRLWTGSRKNPEYAKRLIERTGRLPTTPKAGCIWVHAVSVGESIAATPLITALLEKYPEQELLVTCTTPTGSQTIQKAFGGRVHHSYFPYDYQWFVNRFLKQAQPKMLILMETELWPNMLMACHRRGVKTAIVNLRLSDKSFKLYKRLSYLLKPILKHVDVFSAQTEVDGQRIVQMGAATESVSVTGNLKYDNVDSIVEKGDDLVSQLDISNRMVWCAGSTHQGEDEMVLTAHRALLQQIPGALLVIAPRHPERFTDVSLLSESRFITQRWSNLVNNDQPAEATEVLILDTIGDLKQFIALSNFCFIGGSLVNVGGHNVLEACGVGVPVLFGPYMQNFKQIAEKVVQSDSGVQVLSEEELITKVAYLASNAALRQAMAVNGVALIQRNRGALKRTLKLVHDLNSG